MTACSSSPPPTLSEGARTLVGLATLHPGTDEGSDPRVAPRPGRAAGQGPRHAGGGRACPPGGAEAPPRAPTPAGHLLAAKRESLYL